jgi:hypothetical protein
MMEVRHRFERRFERAVSGFEVAVGHRQEPGCAQGCQHLELNLVKERTARERVDHFDRLDFLARLEPQNRLEIKTVRAGGKTLQCGRGI